jgi:hypothetical protein
VADASDGPPRGGRAGGRGGERAGEQAGPASWVGPEAGGGPIWKENPFSFSFSTKQHKTSFLSKIKIFLGFGVKIKVAQNFIMYNIALGFILKF